MHNIGEHAYSLMMSMMSVMSKHFENGVFFSWERDHTLAWVQSITGDRSYFILSGSSSQLLHNRILIACFYIHVRIK